MSSLRSLYSLWLCGGLHLCAPLGAAAERGAVLQIAPEDGTIDLGQLEQRGFALPCRPMQVELFIDGDLC